MPTDAQSGHGYGPPPRRRVRRSPVRVSEKRGGVTPPRRYQPPPARTVRRVSRPVGDTKGDLGRGDRFKRSPRYHATLARARQARQWNHHLVRVQRLLDLLNRHEHSGLLDWAYGKSHYSYDAKRDRVLYNVPSALGWDVSHVGSARSLLRRHGLLAVQASGELSAQSPRRLVGGPTKSMIAEGQSLSHALTAPALKVLEQTVRPLHATAGAVDAAIRGKNVPRAAWRGAQNKTQTTYSDVLKDLGVKNKAARAIGGGVLDVVGDPSSYLSLGRSVPGKVAAEAAAKKAGADAERAAARELGAKAGTAAGRRAVRRRVSQASRRAYAKTVAKKGTNKGITLGVRAKVPFRHEGFDRKTSGRATAAVARRTGLSRAARVARESEPVQRLGKALAPDFRPRDVSPEAWTAYLEARRARDAGLRLARGYAERRVSAYAKALPSKSYERVVAAVEGAHPAHALPAEEQRVVRHIQGELAAMRRAEQKAGAGHTVLSDYFPHVAKRVTGEQDRPGATFLSRTVFRGRQARLPFSETRKDTRPIAEQRAAEKDVFSTDVPKVMGIRAMKSGEAVADKAYLDRLVSHVGRKVSRGAVDRMNVANEGVYRVTGRSVAEVKHSDIEAALAGRGQPGAHVILPHRIGQGEIKARQIAKSEPGFGAYLHRATNFWKSTVTVYNFPAYDLRNLYGDLHNAYLADTDLKSLHDGFQLSKALSKQEGLEAKLAGSAKATGVPAKLPAKGARALRGKVGLGRRYGSVEKAQVVQWARDDGVVRAGHMGGERFYRSRATTREGFRTRARKLAPEERLRKIGQFREDSVRLGTYISALRKGMSRVQARDWANKHHFDYTELTTAEHGIRRVVPFYTFTARNTRLQASKLVQRPGKFAHIEAFREEAAKAAGVDLHKWEQSLNNPQQRALPFPVKIGGKVVPIFWSPPTQDLNRLPIGGTGIGPPNIGTGKDQAQQFAQMVSPLLKAPAEMLFNYSFYFRQPIYRDAKNPNAPHWVPAPSWALKLPGPVKHLLGVIPNLYAKDKNGKPKKVVGWSALADYLARQFPQGGTVVGIGTQAPSRRGVTAGQQLFGQGTGIRIGTADTGAASKREALNRLDQVDVKMSDMRDRHEDRVGGVATRGYQKLLDERKAILKKYKLGTYSPYRRVARKKGATGSITGGSSGGGGTTSITQGAGGSGGTQSITG